MRVDASIDAPTNYPSITRSRSGNFLETVGALYGTMERRQVIDYQLLVGHRIQGYVLENRSVEWDLTGAGGGKSEK